MRHLLFLLLGLLLSPPVARAQLSPGSQAPALRFTTVLNGPQPRLSLAQLRGKVVLLEFWGTYCGPCVEAMPHLQELQRQFAGRLQVIAISQEAPARLTRYLQARPSNLLFAAVAGTAADSLQRLFSYHIIPHSVLLDATGRVVASTEPKHVTAAVIQRVLQQQPVQLPLKRDNMVADPLATYFPATAATSPRILIQPAIAGAGSMTREYPQDTSAFHGRRLSVLNFSLEGLYRLAYGNLPFDRVLDLRPAPAAKNAPLYCVDLIVAPGQEATLLPTLRQELASRFDLRVALEPRRRPVYLLGIGDAHRLPPVSPTTDKRDIAASSGVYEGRRVALADVADYLESFGIVPIPVLDDTRSTAHYSIRLDYQPEKPADFLRALATQGLTLKKAERTVEMLVIR
jgi:uncharacterized protein (TIGR03435 family)